MRVYAHGKQHTTMNLKRFILLAFLSCTTTIWAATADQLLRLEAEMLDYINTGKRDSFFLLSNQLKEASKEAGNEKLFYQAWTNQAIYEATQQNYEQALKIVKEVFNNTQETGNIYGEYAALHAEAIIKQQQQNYDAAEKAYMAAVEYHHRHFPNESAAEDLLGLMRIANQRNDLAAAERYARQVVNEQNVSTLHKGRALYRLSQIAFDEDDVEKFNSLYDELMKLKDTDGLGSTELLVQVTHSIINDDYKSALRFAEQLSDERCAEWKAYIFHRMGDDGNAYKYMLDYKRISDSITEASHGQILAGYRAQMNNNRMQLQQQLLERRVQRLRSRLYIAVGIMVFLALLFFIWRGHKMVKKLQNDNKQLIYEGKDANRALEDLNELSFYESKAALPLTTPMKPNDLCNHLATSTQSHCHRGVAMVFLTKLPDDLEIITNPDALRTLLKHLLNYSARFTLHGTIKLSCEENGNNVLFSVSDTSAGLSSGEKPKLVGMFSDDGNKIRYVGMNFNICSSICRLLRGRIWHDTNYTDGTRFCFELPKNPSRNY